MDSIFSTVVFGIDTTTGSEFDFITFYKLYFEFVCKEKIQNNENMLYKFQFIATTKGVNNKYRFRYSWQKGNIKMEAVKDIMAPNPISALNQFHQFAQLSRELGSDRRDVIRPYLGPTQYEVKSLHHVYHQAAFERDPSSTPIMESWIDLPNSKNPQLHEVMAKQEVEQPEFDFA
jgi:hypothetical protein